MTILRTAGSNSCSVLHRAMQHPLFFIYLFVYRLLEISIVALNEEITKNVTKLGPVYCCNPHMHMNVHTDTITQLNKHQTVNR